MSSNPQHGPIRVGIQDDVEVSGIVVGAIIGTRRERTGCGRAET